MSKRDEFDILYDGLDDAETIEEIQANALIANDLFEDEFENEEIEFSAGSSLTDSQIERLVRYTEKLQNKLDAVALGENVDTYSIAVGGSITGPSVSVSVTFQPSAELESETQTES